MYSSSITLKKQKNMSIGRSVNLRFIYWVSLALLFLVPGEYSLAFSQQLSEKVELTSADITNLTRSMQASNARERKVTLSLRDTNLEEALQALARQANLSLTYSRMVVPVNKRVEKFDIKDLNVVDALDRLLANTEIVALVRANGQVVLQSDEAGKAGATGDRNAETGTITGVVLDSGSSSGIAGATVSVVGTRLTAITDSKGAFRINGVPPGAQKVTVKLLGYQSRTVDVTVTAEKAVSVNVELKRAATSLDEVVTTVVGEQRKVEIGNDVTTIKVEEVIRNNPVANVTDILKTRAPGVHVAPSSGEPGAPSRVRIRGVNSINTSNEPIIIVDGVQIRSEVREAGSTDPNWDFSPIDQIDINTIEKIEILKGPSAVAMYGSDAANGVIVITSKRGQVSAPRWTANASVARETMPGKWPWNYFAWGESLSMETGVGMQCAHGEGAWYGFPDCRYDSTSKYQILNSPGTTVFGSGLSNQLGVNVSGGVNAFTYSVTGSARSTLGIMKLPDEDLEILLRAGYDVPYVVRKPQSAEMKSIATMFGFSPTPNSSVTYSSTFTRSTRRTTPLVGALREAADMPPPVPVYDANLEKIGIGSGMLVKVPDLMQVNRGTEMGFRNSLTASAPLADHGRATLLLGVDVRSINGSSLLKNGDYCPVTAQVSGIVGNCSSNVDHKRRGSYNTNTGSAVTYDASFRAVGKSIGFQHLNVMPTIGFNFISSSERSIQGLKTGLPIGAVTGSSVGSEQEDRNYSERSGDRRTAGMFLQAEINIANRMWIPLAMRTDAGSSIGGSVRPRFPKLGFSLLASDHPSFSRIPIVGKMPELRIRSSFGASGKQPRPTAKLRTFRFNEDDLGLGDILQASMNSVGNPLLRPERSLEFETGFDATLLDLDGGRLMYKVTWARTNTTDLIVENRLPVSLAGRMQTVNLGDVASSSLEMEVEGFLRVIGLDLSSQVGFARQLSRITSLRESIAKGVSGSSGDIYSIVFLRQVEGYPLNGKWAYPIVAYGDENGNGVIEPSEVIHGDSMVYLGAPYPEFAINSNTQITFMTKLSVSSVLSYEHGATQTTTRNLKYSRFRNDPSISLREQAFGIFSPMTAIQTVSSLRLERVQLTYRLPDIGLLGRINLRSSSIALHGTNLGLWTNYRAKDPGVGAVGDDLRNQYQLPRGRTFGITVRFN